MGIEAWITLVVVAAAVGSLIATRWSPAAIFMGAVTLLMVVPLPGEGGWKLGIIDAPTALKGFSSEGLITVAALFIVAAGIERTGVMNWLVDRLMGRPRSLAAAQRRVMVTPGFMSAFMNNTPIVAMMVPVICDWAKKNRLSVSKLLLPMNNAVVLGGLCTLIGTSTNVVVSGLLQAKAKALGLSEHAHGLGLFEITWIGVPCAIAGIAYMLIASRWLLPDRRPPISEQDDPRQYTVEMLVEEGSPLVGKSIEEAGLRHLPGMYLMEIDRNGRILAAVGPTEKLAANDRLVFVGIVESVKDLQKIRGLKPATNQVFKLDAPRSERRLIEAVVSNSCPLIGKTIREGRFRSAYNAAVIAVGRNGERIKGKIGDIELRAGDTLLLEAHPSFVAQQRNSRDFYLVSEVEGSTPPLYEKAWIAGLILLGMVLAASFEVVPMLHASLAAAGLMLLTRCITTSEGHRAVDWDVLLLIAASFGLAGAMEKTGVASTIANTVIGLGGNNPWASLAMVYLVTMCFTELMSNNAAAVLVFPIAWAASQNLGVNYVPFVMAVCIGASCGFATPMGYQTNLMVYGPGGYRFTDYVRYGGLLNLIVMAVTVTLAPIIWPFR